MARFETTLIGTTTVAEGTMAFSFARPADFASVRGVDRGASSCACASPAVRLHHAAAATAPLRQAPRAAGRAVPYRGAASRRCLRRGAARTGRNRAHAAICRSVASAQNSDDGRIEFPSITFSITQMHICHSSFLNEVPTKEARQ